MHSDKFFDVLTSVVTVSLAIDIDIVCSIECALSNKTCFKRVLLSVSTQHTSEVWKSGLHISHSWRLFTMLNISQNSTLWFYALTMDSAVHKKIQKLFSKICKKLKKHFSKNLSTFSVFSSSAGKRSKPTVKWLGCCYKPFFEELSIMVAKSRKLTGR